MSKTLRALVNDPTYYMDVATAIHQLGYNNPQQDPDKRQRMLYGALTAKDVNMEIVEAYDCSSLAPRSGTFYRFHQTRSDCEGNVDDIFEQIYLDNKRAERMPMGWIMEDGQLYIFSGNTRMRAHLKAIELGYDSKCAVLIVSRNDLTTAQQKSLAHKWARIANKKKNDVRAESTADFILQLIVAGELHRDEDATALSWTEDKWIEWGKSWLIENIDSDLGLEHRKKQLGNMANAAFASHRGQSLPMPNTQEIEEHLKSFWPKASWDPDAHSKVLKFTCCTRTDKIHEKMRYPWMKRPQFTEVRSRAWFVLRAGSSLNVSITSVTDVTKERERAIKHLTEYNLNVNVVGAGMPMVTRVMFVKQMDLDDYQAYEWNFDDECYDEVGPR